MGATMINIADFSKNVNKSIETILSWLEKGYVPGAIKDEQNEWAIPDSARAPYLNAKAKTPDSIFVSIVKASYQRKHVFAKLYGITSLEFDGYIEQLVTAGLIVKRIEDNITYYDATLRSKEYIDKNSKKYTLHKFVLDAIEKVSKGTTTAVMEEATK